MIDVAIVGAGHWGPNLVRLFDNRRASRVRVVADLDEERLAQVRERFPEAQTTTEAGEAISHPDVEAVVIATPTTTHYELARLALDQGKHVFVEKPITAEVTQGEALCDLAEENGLVLMVGHVFLFNAGVRRVKEEIDSGALGRIYYLSMVRTNLGPIRADVNAAWDLASHDISIASYWLGNEPLAASAVGGTWINEGVEDAVFATLRYPGGVLVNLHSSWLNPVKSRGITVVGERRMLTFDDLDAGEPVRIYDKGVTDQRRATPFTDSFASFRSSVREGDITIPKVAAREPLAEEIAHFLSCVADGTTPVSDGRRGVGIVAALDAIRRSLAADGAEQEIRTAATEPTGA